MCSRSRHARWALPAALACAASKLLSPPFALKPDVDSLRDQKHSAARRSSTSRHGIVSKSALQQLNSEHSRELSGAYAQLHELISRTVPHLAWARRSVEKLLSALLACLLGLLLSLSPAAAEGSQRSTPDEETVESALGFIGRNFYDQSFNNQDWEKARARYRERVQKGEKAPGLVREMVDSLGDRYSRVIDAGTFEQLMAYDPLGVGLVLARNEDKEIAVSSPPFGGSAAAKAGIKQGDLVTAIDGISFKEQSLFSVMDRVAQGDAAQVTLSLQRGKEIWNTTLARVRQALPQNQVDYGIVTARRQGNHKIGYLRLRNFGARSALDIRAALEKLRSQGAEELVLDLRGNGGGSFQAALEVAEIFLEPGTLAAKIKTPTADNVPLNIGESQGSRGVATEPLALLVDGGSASASEVLSVALRGNCRATLLGSRTYGKAAVQGVFGLPNKEAVALTVARYSGPAGTRIEGGLEPDLPGPGGTLPSGFLPGGGSSLAAAFNLLGLPVQLQEGDYASLDIPAACDASLKSCKAGEVW